MAQFHGDGKLVQTNSRTFLWEITATFAIPIEHCNYYLGLVAIIAFLYGFVRLARTKMDKLFLHQASHGPTHTLCLE